MGIFRRLAAKNRGGAHDRRGVRIREDRSVGYVTAALCVALVMVMIYFVAELMLR